MIPVIRPLIFIPVTIVLLSPTVVSGATAQDWLMKIQYAAGKQNYIGVFVYRHSNQLESMRIIHQVKNGKIRERIISLNGAPREIIRVDNVVWRYFPDKKTIILSERKLDKKSFPALLPATIKKLTVNYSVRLGRLSRIADRNTRLINVMPKDQYRYGYRLWADSKTGLLLKADLVNAKGQSLEQYMFTQITVGRQVPDALVRPRTSKRGMRLHREKSYKQGIRDTVIVGYLPRGFVLAKRKKRYCQKHRAAVEQRVYSDGLAAVSVFIEEIIGDRERDMTGPHHMGAYHTYTRVINNYQVTVVGQVPAATVRNIGQSISFK